MCIEYPVHRETCAGRAVRNRRAYVGIGHALACIPHQYNAHCTYIGPRMSIVNCLHM